jgi:hypothetical protein
MCSGVLSPPDSFLHLPLLYLTVPLSGSRFMLLCSTFVLFASSDSATLQGDIDKFVFFILLAS